VRPRSILLRMIGKRRARDGDRRDSVRRRHLRCGVQANTRNLALLARYQLDPIGSRRSSRFLVFGFSLLLALVVAFVIAVPVLVIVALFKLF
jgi:hypothetical protein